MDKNEILSDLSVIDSDLISLEAMSRGFNVSESGAILDIIEPDYLVETPFNMFETLRIGEEAMINKSAWGRIFGRLNVLFSMNHDSRMAKRAGDLNYINSGTVNPGSSNVKFDNESINLFLNAFNYQRVDRSKVSELEPFRQRLIESLNDTSSYLYKALKLYFGGVVVALILFLVSIPLAILFAFVVDICIYYYVIMAALSFLGFEDAKTSSMTSSEMVPFVCKLIGAIYENGSGKKVKYEPDGTLSMAELSRISVDIEDATNRMNSSFARCSGGVNIEYNDKLKIANQLKGASATIIQKYTDPNISKKGLALYNLVATKIAKRERKAMQYNDYSQRMASICDALHSIIVNSQSCDKNLTTIVRGLYRM